MINNPQIFNLCSFDLKLGEINHYCLQLNGKNSIDY